MSFIVPYQKPMNTSSERADARASHVGDDRLLVVDELRAEGERDQPTRSSITKKLATSGSRPCAVTGWPKSDVPKMLALCSSAGNIAMR